jgi:predicted DNA-binding ribbon-helix-helix protein
MTSLIAKRSIVIAGHKTSISLEDAFWIGLKELAIAQRTTVSNLVGDIDSRRERGNLSSAIRLFVLHQLRAPAAGTSPDHAGNGVASDMTFNASQSF